MDGLDELDEADLSLLRLLSRGMTTGAVARELGVSERTVRRRGRLICDALGVDTPIEAVVHAVRAERI